MIRAWLLHEPEGVRERLARAERAAQRYEDTGETANVAAYDPAAGGGAAMFSPINYYTHAQRGAVLAWHNQFAVPGWKEWLELDAVAPVCLL
ncbi:MAG TPA: hypothetical protein VF690_09745 [Hymenobacter sp.]|jgi:hypothetical protein